MSRNAAEKDKSGPTGIRMLVVKFCVAYIAFLIFVVLLTILMKQLFARNIFECDQQVFSYLSKYISQRNTNIMEVFTFLGSHKFLIPAFLLLFAYYYFIRRDKWYSIRIALFSVSNLLLLFGFKFFFGRSRPHNPLLGEVPGLSFPSGHALMGLIFFGLIINIIYRELINKWIKWMFIIILVMVILLIGLSRIYLRLHYPSDVTAGYFFGLTSFLMLLWILRNVEIAVLKERTRREALLVEK